MSELSRRDVLKVGALGGMGVLGLAGCGAAAAPAAAPAAPGLTAAGTWALNVTAGIAAALAAEALDGAWAKAWRAWKEPTREAVGKQYEQGWEWHLRSIYAHALPGASMTMTLRTARSNPATDRLLITFRDGRDIALDSWAWKALNAVITEESGDRTGDDLLRTQQLLAQTLIPAGPSSSRGSTSKKTAWWITYPARTGEVEIMRSRAATGDTVTVKATGLFSGSAGNPTVRSYPLR
jgi:hypothetical protein